VDQLDCRFVADLHCDQGLYLQDPKPCVPEWSARGKRPSRLKAQAPSIRVDPWAAEQPAEASGSV